MTAPYGFPSCRAAYVAIVVVVVVVVVLLHVWVGGGSPRRILKGRSEGKGGEYCAKSLQWVKERTMKEGGNEKSRSF